LAGKTLKALFSNVYSKKHNCLFIHIPKTGGTSIIHVFLRENGYSWDQRELLFVRENLDPGVGPPQTAHFTLQEYQAHPSFCDVGFAKLNMFSVVRNPFSRIWSEYKYNWRDEVDWPDFCSKDFIEQIEDDHKTGSDRKRHLLPQSAYFQSTAHICILRFESLQYDFQNWLGRDLKLPHENQSMDLECRWGSDQIKTVIDIYRSDFDRFGYSTSPFTDES